MTLHGCITALVTPFRKGKLDLAGLRRNVAFQLENQVSGVLVAGSTGESPNLTEDEHERAVRAVRSVVSRKALLVVGVGTNSTAKSIRQAKRAEALGADAVLVVAPYYNKPNQEGLYRHFREVADSVTVPVVVYNIPPRSVVNVLPATVERLARSCGNIVAVKEASGSLDQCTEIVRRCGDRVTVLSGDDSLTLPILSVGGKGVVSVVSNVVPLDVVRMVDYSVGGDTELAAVLHRKLFPLVKAMFIESNPVPVKAAMEMLGMASGAPRLPLVPASEASRKEIRHALRAYGLSPRRA